MHHERSPRALPGQYVGESWSGTGYEQGGYSSDHRLRVHALRPSVRPEGRRRETLCGALAAPVPGRHFSSRHPKACRTCATLTESTPLRQGINPSNELALLRALIVEAEEQRVPVDRFVDWLRSGWLARATATPSRRPAR